MCTIIVTIRTVLWAVMTIAGSLMILVSLFTNRWLIGGLTNLPTNAGSAASFANNLLDEITDGGMDGRVSYGIFLDCVKPQGSLVRILDTDRTKKTNIITHNSISKTNMI